MLQLLTSKADVSQENDEGRFNPSPQHQFHILKHACVNQLFAGLNILMRVAFTICTRINAFGRDDRRCGQKRRLC